MSVGGMHGSTQKHHRQAAKSRHKARKRIRAAQRKRDREVTAQHGAHGHGACGRKVRHRSETEALRAALRAMRKGAPPLWVYPCRFCGGWHLTSHPEGGSAD
ncbi:MAG: hypothetical protein IKG69_00520 [Atopobiaceae bacterium]|nr:hypothetical protein [Atopobiaceae bacterium]